MRIIGEKRNTSKTATVTDKGEFNLEMFLVILTSTLDKLSVDSISIVYSTSAWWLWLKTLVSIETLKVVFIAGIGCSSDDVTNFKVARGTCIVLF